jgi:predicted ATPase
MLFFKSLDHEEEFYDANSDSMHHWKLTNLTFSKFTIIAGLNGTGKTRTCNVIRNTVKKIIEPMKTLMIGKTDLTFSISENQLYKFMISIQEDINRRRSINKEELYDVGETGALFTRDNLLFNRRVIYDANLKKHTDYSPPDDTLTFHVRRDKVSYPYIEEIINEMRKFHFLDSEEPPALAAGDISGGKLPPQLPIEILPSLTPLWFGKIEHGKKIEILDDLNSLEFPIKNIFVKEIILAGQRIPMLYFEEEGVKGTYDFFQISSGMKKILFVIVFLHLIEKGSCVLMDNVGDGLDYKRSINILPIIEKIAADKQIIISTNNEILLNQTDIRNWNILFREGDIVKAYNYENSKEQLMKFANTGLSNYEYFQDKYFLR